MSEGFVKIYESILHSTVWLEPSDTKVVWITMLAMSDTDGVVRASVPGLAKAAGVSREACDAALACFMSPDPDSRTKEFDGRRIEQIDGGWFLINYGKYFQKRTEKQIKDNQRQASKRERDRHAVSRDVTRCHALSREVALDLDLELDLDKTTTPTGLVGVAVKKKTNKKPLNNYQAFMDTWNENVEGTPFPKINTIAGKRQRTLATRLKDYPNLLDMLVPVINYISGIEFYTGKNDRGWIASFDYLMQDGKMNELFEKATHTGPAKATKMDIYEEMYPYER